MSREPVAWVFNLDAEDELSRPGPHTPSKETRARVEHLLPHLHALMLPNDEVLWPGDGRPVGARIGRAWCPTTWALAQCARAKVQLPPAPAQAVLRQVNHRQFAHELGQALPLARFVRDEAQLLETLSQVAALAAVSVERNWLMKRPLGYAGRGRRKIASSTLNAADRTWVDAAFREGDGLQVEPLVARVGDFGLHGWLEPDGALRLGQPTMQDIDASGMWHSTVVAPPTALSLEERRSLEHEARLTATALHRVGYFGPFGLDAFRWRAPEGTVHFQPRCEVNARYSMGWAIGMGDGLTASSTLR